MIIPKNIIKFINNIKNKLTLTSNIKRNVNQHLFIKIINK